MQVAHDVRTTVILAKNMKKLGKIGKSVMTETPQVVLFNVQNIKK